MRVGNRLPAALVAAVLAAAGVIAVLEIIAAAGGHGPMVVDWPAWSARLASWAWSSGAVRLCGVLLTLAGLAVLLLGRAAGGGGRFEAHPSAAGTVMYVRRRALSRALRAAALSVDGITAASVRVRRRRAVVRTRLRPRTSAGAVAQVRSRLAGTVESFDLTRPPRLVIEVGGRAARGPR